MNEIFQPQNRGEDLKKSLLILINKCKNQLDDPEFMKIVNIFSIHKNKGSKMLLENDRGLFISNVIRMIKDRLIYNDIKDILDKNMSDSQVGARPKRGIRDHLFVIYSIIHSVKKKEGKPIDIEMIDIKKCFDSLWLEECINQLYETGIQNDKLALIYEGNSENQVAILTPGAGLTDRMKIERIVM